MFSDVHHGNLVLCPNALGKHRLGPHPFKSPTSKPPCMQSPKSQCQNHVFIANLQKLRFYQNIELSLDRCCGVPNTFVTRNQTFRLKNQDFLPSTLDQEKRHFSQPRMGNKINQKQVINHTLKKTNYWWRPHLPLVIPLKLALP